MPWHVVVWMAHVFILGAKQTPCSSTSLGERTHNKKNGIQIASVPALHFCLSNLRPWYMMCHDATWFLPARYLWRSSRSHGVSEVQSINIWHHLITNDTRETTPLDEQKRAWSRMELIDHITSLFYTFWLAVKMLASFPWLWSKALLQIESTIAAVLSFTNAIWWEIDSNEMISLENHTLRSWVFAKILRMSACVARKRNHSKNMQQHADSIRKNAACQKNSSC